MAITNYNSKYAKNTGSVPVDIKSPSSAFGEISIAENVPIWQSDFVYADAHEQLHIVTEQAGGAVSFSNQLAVCSSGSTALGLAAISSKRPLVYRPGQGGLARFTTIFSTPTAASIQSAGLSNGETGLLVGYFFNTSFGIRRQHGGAREIRTLTVTTGASAGGSVTVTLNSQAATATVTANNDVEKTAWEIATTGNYSTLDSVGWEAHAEGAKVIFIRKQTSAAAGTYSVSGQSVAGTFAQTVAAVAPSNDDVLQANFNLDTLDGNGPSGIVLDPTKGNVYQIEFQYLGFGNITFSVEDPDTGRFVPFHRYKYANNNTTPSLSNPSISWSMSAYNFSGSGHAVTVKAASAALYSQGPRTKPRVTYGISGAATGMSANARTPVLTIKPMQVYKGRLMLAEAILDTLAVATEGTKPFAIEILADASLSNDANFMSVGGDSFMMYDTSATSIADGRSLFNFATGRTGSEVINIRDTFGSTLTRLSKISIVVTPKGGTADADVSFTWSEDI